MLSVALCAPVHVELTAFLFSYVDALSFMQCICSQVTANILLCICNGYRLMIGLMLPTWFLSMWISNTAATSMMIPIIEAVVTTLEEVNKHAGSYMYNLYKMLYE